MRYLVKYNEDLQCLSNDEYMEIILSAEEFDGFYGFQLIAKLPDEKIEKDLKVYIASPYTIGNQEENVLKQIRFADELISLGFYPHVPLLTHFQHIVLPRDYEEWMKQDFVWLKQCDAIFRLGGESCGADREVRFAFQNDIPVFYDINDLIEWKKFLLKS